MITAEEFADAAAEFLQASAQEKAPDRKFDWGEGPDALAIFDGRDPFEEHDAETQAALLAEARAFRAKRFDAGFGWITGPEQYGGRALPDDYQRAYNALEARFDVPSQVSFLISQGWVAPTLLVHGTGAAKDRYLKALYRGDVLACQLFSEPGAGSDLASLQTRADRDGDDWVVTGQKVWTTGAQYSDIGEIIARTDPDQPKHKGLTGFLVDMNAAGVEVRPLRQMTGGATFNEVFLTEVRVPDDHRLGEINGGWGVAHTTLMNERTAIGDGDVGVGANGLLARAIDVSIEMTRALGVADQPLVRQQLADLIVRSRVAQYTNLRTMEQVRSGRPAGYEPSIAKLMGNQLLSALTDFVSGVLGAKLTADSGEWGTYVWTQVVLGAPGMRIGGGTDEIMRNILGERALGLPRDPGFDPTTPFRNLRVGTQPA